MSKMKMPEMNVVRFNESDVIVASMPPRVVRFNLYADAISNNGTVSYGGKTYGYTTQQEPIENSFLADPNYSEYGVQSVNGWITFADLMNVERTSGYGSDNGVVNGTYYWDATQNKYKQ